MRGERKGRGVCGGNERREYGEEGREGMRETEVEEGEGGLG
jgi:hypothetical protein